MSGFWTCHECGAEMYGFDNCQFCGAQKGGGEEMSGEVMSFPNNWWTFVQQYQFADKDEVYTNGSMLIPSFRVRQMVEHYFGGEVGKTSRYAELFGTPERAARTLALQCFGATSEACDTCVFGECDGKLRNSGAYPTVYDALLEWLRGDA